MPARRTDSWAAWSHVSGPHASAVTPTDMGHGAHAVSTVLSSNPKIQRWSNYWKSPSELLEAEKIIIIFEKNHVRIIREAKLLEQIRYSSPTSPRCNTDCRWLESLASSPSHTDAILTWQCDNDTTYFTYQSYWHEMFSFSVAASTDWNCYLNQLAISYPHYSHGSDVKQTWQLSWGRRWRRAAFHRQAAPGAEEWQVTVTGQVWWLPCHHVLHSPVNITSNTSCHHTQLTDSPTFSHFSGSASPVFFLLIHGSSLCCKQSWAGCMSVVDCKFLASYTTKLLHFLTRANDPVQCTGWCTV